MRLVILLALLSGCINAQPFDLTITNDGDGPTFLAAGEGSGVLVGVQEQIGSQWFFLSSSLEGMCSPQCGQLGPTVCAGRAAELSAVYGLMPGDSVTKSFDGEFWYYDEVGSCARQAPLTGALRATICHGTSAQNEATGEIVDQVDQSGLLDANSGATVLAANCDDLDFTVADPDIVIAD